MPCDRSSFDLVHYNANYFDIKAFTLLDEAIHTLTFIPYAWHPNDKTYISKWCSKCSSCPPSTSRDMSSKRPPPSFMTCQRSTGKKEPALAWPQSLVSMAEWSRAGVWSVLKCASRPRLNPFATYVKERLLGIYPLNGLHHPSWLANDQPARKSRP